MCKRTFFIRCFDTGFFKGRSMKEIQTDEGDTQSVEPIPQTRGKERDAEMNNRQSTKKSEDKKEGRSESEKERKEKEREGKPDKASEKKKKSGVKWALKIFFLTILFSVVFSLISELVISSAGLVVAVVILVILIAINILFDIIGVAAATCDPVAFKAMAAKRVKGAKAAIWIAKNAEKVTNICADVIGDICGIVSGAAGAAVLVKIIQYAQSLQPYEMAVSIAISALIAGFTVGGKALGKKTAMENANAIIFAIGRFFSIFMKKS